MSARNPLWQESPLPLCYRNAIVSRSGHRNLSDLSREVLVRSITRRDNIHYNCWTANGKKHGRSVHTKSEGVAEEYSGASTLNFGAPAPLRSGYVARPARARRALDEGGGHVPGASAPGQAYAVPVGTYDAPAVGRAPEQAPGACSAGPPDVGQASLPASSPLAPPTGHRRPATGNVQTQR